ncbi:MAG TPA: hypothetical protein VK034_19825 [Enhygromyxa sp.]|nr:hypothetical protein [Enhygromyxa sp.]
MPRSSIGIMLALGLGLACTEPNPYAQEAGADSTETGADSTETGDDPPGCGDPACELGLELVTFSLQGDDTFTAQIPKPAEQDTVPIAAIRRYAPGQSETFGFAIDWTDDGDSWGLEVTTSGAAANSRIEGVAVVIGLGEDFPAPELHELEISTADGCGELETDALDGRFFVDTVERYDPGGAEVFEFSRTATVGETAAVEYCVSQPEQLDATLGVKLIAFSVPEGALAVAAGAVLDSGGGANESFGSLGNVDEVVHLIGARALSEASEPALGYAVECSTTPPYECSYDLLGFSGGAAVEVGGAAIAIQ